MKDKFLKFHKDEILGKKGRHDFPNTPLDFLIDNDIYLHFTNEKHLGPILLNDDAKGIRPDLGENNARKAGYYTKDARSYSYGHLCFVVDLSGLLLEELQEEQQEGVWGVDSGNVGLPSIYIKDTVPIERIIGYWIHGEEIAAFNDKYNIDCFLK